MGSGDRRASWRWAEAAGGLRPYQPSGFELERQTLVIWAALLLAGLESLPDLLTCAQLYCFTSWDAIGGLFEGKLVPDQGRGEKLALSQLDAVPLRGTDGGKVGGCQQASGMSVQPLQSSE